jgi:hypothetical protein
MAGMRDRGFKKLTKYSKYLPYVAICPEGQQKIFSKKSIFNDVIFLVMVLFKKYIDEFVLSMKKMRKI